ncbi:MAG: ABC transporter permease [Bryobacteraceae bacterium]
MIWRRKRMLESLDRDFEDHVRRETEDNIDRGMSPERARYAALRKFGNVTRLKEDTRDVWRLVWLEQLLQDLRYGVRTLLRNARFTAVSVFALALGIGVNTAAFTAYKAFIARPLDARDPDRMVNFALRLQSGATKAEFSYPDYETYRNHLHSFNGVIAFYIDQLRLTGAGGIVSQRNSEAGSLMGRLGLLRPGASNAEFASTFIVSENYFAVLGVAALRGRTFESIRLSELAASPSVLISENYWQKRFAGDPAVLGKSIRLNGAAFTISGITPHNFVGTSIAVPDFWLPLSLDRLVHSESNRLHDREDLCCRVFGRLAPGVSMPQAQAETTLLASHLRTLHDPHSDLSKDVTASISPGSPLPGQMNPNLRLTILLIMVAVGMVLVIACANAASLQLARATTRQQELGMRLSLGASRARLIRQLLTESALLGLLAGCIALPFTWTLLHVAVTKAAEALPPEDVTLVFNVNPDLEIFSYVLAISAFAGILFGLAPAIESSRSALLSTVRGARTSSARSRLRHLLIAAQVAVSLTLMIAGSMLVRSAIHALRMNTGYDGDRVVDLSLQFPEESKYTANHKAALVRDLRTRLPALPGGARITSARAPDDDGGRRAAVSLNGEQPSARNRRALLYYTWIQANYFQTLGIPLLLGRGFQLQAGQPERVAILSESAAQRLWPGQSPIGRSLRLGTNEQFHNKGELLPDGPAWQVIGVARDTRGVTLDGSDSGQVYLPLPSDRLQDYPILVRTQSDPTLVMRAMDPVISAVDPNLVASTSTLQDMLHRTDAFLADSLSAAIATTISLFGLILASMGIYSTVSYMVVLRTHEVGIRMAIGAQKGHILALMMRESARPVVGGLLAGMVLAAGASQLLRGVLYGLNMVDPISFVGASLLFLAIALVATWLPSRRAMRVDPMVALRYE